MPIGVATLKILSGNPVGPVVGICARTLYKILGSSSPFEPSWVGKGEVLIEVVRKFWGLLGKKRW